MLVILSGLPGVGKSAIANALGREMQAPVISVDPIEAAISRSGIPHSFETGLAAYKVGAALAGYQLRLGLTVIADAANYVEVGRAIWRDAANAAGTPWRAIEVVCSDDDEHRRRLGTRRRGLEPYPEPTWEAVLRRREETEPWGETPLTIDAVASIDVNVAKLSTTSTRDATHQRSRRSARSRRQRRGSEGTTRGSGWASPNTT